MRVQLAQRGRKAYKVYKGSRALLDLLVQSERRARPLRSLARLGQLVRLAYKARQGPRERQDSKVYKV